MEALKLYLAQGFGVGRIPFAPRHVGFGGRRAVDNGPLLDG